MTSRVVTGRRLRSGAVDSWHGVDGGGLREGELYLDGLFLRLGLVRDEMKSCREDTLQRENLSGHLPEDARLRGGQEGE